MRSSNPRPAPTARPIVREITDGTRVRGRYCGVAFEGTVTMQAADGSALVAVPSITLFGETRENEVLFFSAAELATFEIERASEV